MTTGKHTQRNGVSMLECRDVYRSFGAIKALRGATLTVHAGTVHGLVGHNGAGKSTMVNVIRGAMKWESGSVRFDGEEIEHASQREAIQRGIASVPQELTLLHGMTVTDNINVGDEPRRGPLMRWREAYERAGATLEQLGLADLPLRANVDDLSASQKRMVMLAHAVSRNCRLLILDEPTASLGTDEALPLLSLIESLPGRGITVLYISHRLDEVARLCDRVTVMRDGVDLGVLDRGQFNAETLVRSMVDDLPEHPTRPPRDRSQDNVAVAVRGLHGKSLHNLDVKIRGGSITGFTGLVGSGADELLDILVGAAPALAGSIEIDGRPVHFRTVADALQSGVGYLPGARAAAAMVDLSVRENVLASSLTDSARFGVVIPRLERARAREVVRPFGLSERAERRFGELSGGNQQKVLIGRLLAANARIIVVNDPTAGVDVRARAEIHELLRTAADEGRTVVVRCSEPEELVGLADEIHVLAGGHLARSFDGTNANMHGLLEAAAQSGARLGVGRG
jgi:ribose transport system ATP-binding protein